MKFVASLTLLFLGSNTFFAQEIKTQPDRYTAHNKGKFSISWGGNREKFSKSDMHFVGNDYDFTLYNVKAHDKPIGWDVEYLNPAKASNPQTNLNLSYYISDHYNISIGFDHMKYVMTNAQVVNIGGGIGPSYPDYTGIYTKDGNGNIDLSDGKFLRFEHTNGLNYIFTSVARVDDLSNIFGLPNTDKFQINLSEGIGTGILVPKTDATLMGKQRHDEFHVSGFGIDAKAGINFTFFKHFFVQGDLKGGYINMGSIRTTYDLADKATQDFFFIQSIISVGGIFKV